MQTGTDAEAFYDTHCCCGAPHQPHFERGMCPECAEEAAGALGPIEGLEAAWERFVASEG